MWPLELAEHWHWFFRSVVPPTSSEEVSDCVESLRNLMELHARILSRTEYEQFRSELCRYSADDPELQEVHALAAMYSIL